MPPTNYRYELRQADAIAATGHITLDEPVEIGDEIRIGRKHGIVRQLGPRLADGEFRLVIELSATPTR